MDRARTRALPFAHPRTWAYFATDTDQDGRDEFVYAGADLDVLRWTRRSELLTGTANGHGASTRVDYARLHADRDYLPVGSLPPSSIPSGSPTPRTTWDHE